MNLLIESVTNTQAAVTITGMLTAVPICNKKITYEIRKSSGGSWRTDDVVYITTTNGIYTYFYRGLDTGTEYDIRVTVEMQTVSGDYMDEGVLTGAFTTSGAGPAGNPYFTYSYDNDSVTINVFNSDGNYIWFRCEYDDGTKVFDSDDYGRGRGAREVITGLRAGTRYWIRVSYSTSSNGSLTRILSVDGNQWESFTTEGQPPSSGGGCFIYLNGNWRHAKPYIYLSGSWRPATPYIYRNNHWTQCT